MAYTDPARRKRVARLHYEANKEVYKERAAEHRKKNKAVVVTYLRAIKSRPCTDCNAQYPYYVMQFDHRPDTVKLFNLADGSRGGYSMPKVQAEVEKCDVVCANCHAERTFQRLHASDLEF